MALLSTKGGILHELNRSVTSEGRSGAALWNATSFACQAVSSKAAAVLFSTAWSVVAEPRNSSYDMDTVAQSKPQENDTAYPVVVESVCILDLDHELGR